MCVVCGCNDKSQARIEDTRHGHAHHHHGHEAAHPHSHDHAHDHAHAHGLDMHFGQGAAGVSVVGMSPERTIELETNVLGANNRIAARNRTHFHEHGVLALNLVSSPGSGKTTLLCETIRRLKAQHPAVPIAVIEGDQQTSNDADRIRATGAPAIQVNTGKGCHLDAEMVEQAFDRPPIHDALGKAGGILMIENVGNLVCPAMWDLGEAAKVAVLSVTEGEDKPLKYPDMFAAADLMILNKIDLLPHLDFDVDAAIANARRVNPRIDVLQVSATKGDGMEAWLHWMLHALDHARGVDHAHPHDHAAPAAGVGAVDAAAELASLKARIAELESQLSAQAR